MRERPNAAGNPATLTSDSRPNDLYRSLERTFEHFLQNGDPDRYTLLEDSYVSHLEMEAALQNYCAGDTSAAAFLIGATGIGKSTLIRHRLQLNRAPTLIDGSLLIPFSLNQRHVESNADMRKQLAKVFQEAIWLIKIPASKHYSTEDIDQLAQFIERSSPDLLNDPQLDLTRTVTERTKALSNSPDYAYQFALVALKHYAVCNPNVRRIVLVLDDLEMKSHELQENAMTNGLESRECLMNAVANRSIPVRLLVAIRPETHIWMSRLTQVLTTEFREITYYEPVSLFDIFKKRFDAVFSRDDYQHIRDKSRLTQALSVLSAIGEVLASGFSSRFVRLNNYNLRSSLETFRLVVCNRRWLQKDSEWFPHFTVDEHNFAVSKAAVMRALGMGEGDVYPQKRTCLANILWNTREPVSDLLLLYVIKYLQHRNNDSATSQQLVSAFQRLLGSAFDQHVFAEELEYGLNHGLLHNELSGTGIRITVTPRAKELYVMLEDSTLLLECFRDDISQPLKSGRIAKATMTLGAVDRFVAVAGLIRASWESETRLRSVFSTNGASESGSSYFGSTFESARMRTAFLNSVQAFFSKSADLPTSVSVAVDSLRGLSVPHDLIMVRDVSVEA